MSPYHAEPLYHKSRHAGYAHASSLFPLRIDRTSVPAILDHGARFGSVEVRRACDVYEDVHVGEVACLDEVRLKERVVKCVGHAGLITPHRQLLGQTTVIRMRAISVLQALLLHETNKTALHVFEARLAAGEQLR